MTNLSNISEKELFSHCISVRDAWGEHVKNTWKKYGIDNGRLNFLGTDKEYLNIDLFAYHNELRLYVSKNFSPIINEIKKRLKGSDPIKHNLSTKITYMNAERLERYEEKLDNMYIGWISPRLNNPWWYTHLKRVARYYKQDDYQLIFKQKNREKKLIELLN